MHCKIVQTDLRSTLDHYEKILGIMIYIVEFIMDFILEMLQYSTAAFEVRPIQIIAITRDFVPA